VTTKTESRVTVKCDRCGAKLYTRINLVRAGDQCERALVPAEYVDGVLHRLCPGTFKRVRA
jgi:hypothetical protein